LAISHPLHPKSAKATKITFFEYYLRGDLHFEMDCLRPKAVHVGLFTSDQTPLRGDSDQFFKTALSPSSVSELSDIFYKPATPYQLMANSQLHASSLARSGDRAESMGDGRRATATLSRLFVVALEHSNHNALFMVNHIKCLV
jgi:hypothetical protein